MSAPVFQAPDFELRKVILAQINAHPRPDFHTDGMKVSCICGWGITEDKQTCRSNQTSFRKHQAFAIETAVTAWLDEEIEDAA